jgi:hypothetical protein
MLQNLDLRLHLDFIVCSQYTCSIANALKEFLERDCYLLARTVLGFALNDHSDHVAFEVGVFF